MGPIRGILPKREGCFLFCYPASPLHLLKCLSLTPYLGVLISGSWLFSQRGKDLWESLQVKVIEFRKGSGPRENHVAFKTAFKTLQACPTCIEACRGREPEKHCRRCSFESRKKMTLERELKRIQPLLLKLVGSVPDNE